jgi:hypothetical protein
MSLLQLFVGIILVYGWCFFQMARYHNRIFITFILLTACLITGLNYELRAILLFASFLNVAAISLMISHFLINIKIILSNIKIMPGGQVAMGNHITFYAAGIIILVSLHNLINISDLMYESTKDTINALSPWGLLFEFLIVSYSFFISVSDRDEDISENSFFRHTIFSFSIAFSIILAFIFLGYLPGNTEKSILGIGGVGLGGMSTNETGFLACCLLLSAACCCGY